MRPKAHLLPGHLWVILILVPRGFPTQVPIVQDTHTAESSHKNTKAGTYTHWCKHTYARLFTNI